MVVAIGLVPYSLDLTCYYAAANERTLKISSSVSDSIADSGTVITAIVSPRALNTSNEYPYSPSETG